MEETKFLLNNAVYIPSPNCDNRSDEKDISLVVIHGISLPPGKFGSNAVEEFFCNKLNFNEDISYVEIANLKVSAHLYIKRNGDTIQFVPFNKRAWHAGVSEFKGREACNDFSIGIELEGTDDMAYTAEQYKSLSTALSSIATMYPAIKKESIVGHEHIAPGRKTDPGKFFDWSKVKF